MTEKRMFTQKIIDSDAFLEMPLSAQALYFHLNMRADDDGFVNNPKRVTKLVSASEDDLKILLMKRFIIGFASGVIVIKHWRMHNTLKSDRYHPTDYQEEFAQLGIKQNKAYTDHPEKALSSNPLPPEPEWNQDGTNLEPEIRIDLDLDKSREDKSITEDRKRKRFSVPTVEEVSAYCRERGNAVDPQHFVDYYTSNGWKVGKNPMKDWKAAVRTWEKKDAEKRKKGAPGDKKILTFMDL